MGRKSKPPKLGGLKNNLATRKQIQRTVEINLAEARAVRRMLCFWVCSLNRTYGFGKKRGRKALADVSELAMEWKRIADAKGADYADSIFERRAEQILEGEF